MDSRTAAHVLNQIAALLELTRAPRFRSTAFQKSARAVLSLGSDDLSPLLESGELGKVPGVGPATVAIIRDLVETGESTYLDRLALETPRGLIDMARVPGLGIGKVGLIHRELGIETLDDLETAARDGRLARLPRFGPKTAQRILEGIAFARDSGKKNLYHHGLAHAVILAEHISRHPDVIDTVIAGDVRRHSETIGNIEIVATVSGDPAKVARTFSDAEAVKDVRVDDTRVAIRYIDDTRLDLWCTTADDSAVALWRATGSAAHVTELMAFAEERGFSFNAGQLIGPAGKPVELGSEGDLFDALGLSEIPPELREGTGEILAAATGDLPDLITSEDLKGALHCHSTYSDGGATIGAMALAAKELGWKYIGISDHSQAAFYAGGMKREDVLRQHDEIDELNSAIRGFRILKGIECDILTDGRLDYDEKTLELFDYVIGSVHSQFKMDQATMTARILKAMDDPHLTILGHATGRLLLSRSGYPLDIDAVIDKAADKGIALELNCDPRRMDLNWRYCRQARDRGVSIEIGPDAHSERALENVEFGVGMARKAWLSKGDVLNAGTAAQVLKFAQRRPH